MDKMTREEQIRLMAYQQAAPLVMMDKQRFNIVATVQDITEKAKEIAAYIEGR
jgi:hypothetical protein